MNALLALLSLLALPVVALADSDDPERMSDQEKCEERIASVVVESRQREKICGRVGVVGYRGYERCLDAFDAEWKSALLNPRAIREARLEAAIHCHNQDAYVRANTSSIAKCMLKLPSFDACKHPRARANPAKFHACREALAKPYGYDKATQTCTIPHVLKDPVGFLKRNPGKPQSIQSDLLLPPAQPQKDTGKGALKK